MIFKVVQIEIFKNALTPLLRKEIQCLLFPVSHAAAGESLVLGSGAFSL
jgi:hypothetical protein